MSAEVPWPAQSPPQGRGQDAGDAAAEHDPDVRQIRLRCDEVQPPKQAEERGDRRVGEQIDVKSVHSKTRREGAMLAHAIRVWTRRVHGGISALPGASLK